MAAQEFDDNIPDFLLDIVAAISTIGKDVSLIGGSVAVTIPLLSIWLGKGLYDIHQLKKDVKYWKIAMWI